MRTVKPPLIFSLLFLVTLCLSPPARAQSPAHAALSSVADELVAERIVSESGPACEGVEDAKLCLAWHEAVGDALAQAELVAASTKPCTEAPTFERAEMIRKAPEKLKEAAERMRLLLPRIRDGDRRERLAEMLSKL